ncbi:MAG TPA: hypothetical protein VFA48_05640 [Gammaproteobacteria bacterium]|nr:hypothetical protein [Gammaproteobacteria bacterium]
MPQFASLQDLESAAAPVARALSSNDISVTLIAIDGSASASYGVFAAPSIEDKSAEK